ncbi:MAG TPA: DUF3861 domain-containing protein [Ferrovibrio sp.]|uniref:DUF3861 domain-containing protein n=1 Tax=Ferrovibrio sp. TaxID=1917215 RepID=UPI002ED13D2D
MTAPMTTTAPRTPPRGKPPGLKWISDIEQWKGHDMQGHRYRVTVEHLAAPRNDQPVQPPLSFEVINHDEIIGIVERARAGGEFEEEEAAAMAVGLKLFTEVMLKRRSDPLFAEFEPAMRSFIGKLKARTRAAAAASAAAG